MARTKTERVAPTLPAGFHYRSEFLTEAEGRELMERFQHLQFRAFHFQGYIAKRRIVEYGFQYDFSSRCAGPADTIPDFLQPFVARAAAWAAVAPEEIIEAVITEYPPGAPIGWHRDIPQFEMIIGISLASDCRMRLKLYKGQDGGIASIILERRSAYIMRGPARWSYQHSIPAVKSLRYSITFRTPKAPRKTAVS